MLLRAAALLHGTASTSDSVDHAGNFSFAWPGFLGKATTIMLSFYCYRTLKIDLRHGGIFFLLPYFPSYTNVLIWLGVDLTQVRYLMGGGARWFIWLGRRISIPGSE